jgi:pimeloyl-ACP methyl ester carboxylesterase
MRAQPVRIETDTTPLDGLWYEPDDGVTQGVVQLFHGNTMNFYVGPPRFLPPVLTDRGFACLAYNRRGHDVLSNRDSRDLEGGAYQTIAEAIEDNELAHRWIVDRGLGSPILVGHSNGGTLAARHAAAHPEVPALVLLSAHRGGKDLFRMISAAGLMAGDDFDQVTARARALVAAGNGNELMLVPGWWYVISARTYVEFLDNGPDLLELAPSVSCPTLYLRGDEEPAGLYPAEEFAHRCHAEVDIEIVSDCGHYYLGHEETVADLIAVWLARRLLDGNQGEGPQS